MLVYKRVLKWCLLLFASFVLANCGGGGAGSGVDTATDMIKDTGSDEFNQTQYKGLVFYHKNLPSSAYRLEQIADSYFNSLSDAQKLQVANKLLTTLFWGYSLNELKEKIDSKTFISDIRASLDSEKTDKEWLESYIMDDNYFKQYTKTWEYPQVVKILTRFYAMKKLDKYYLNNWVAYILTQTIMFSPAYELSTTHTPNISRVYNRLVNMLENESGMRFITYVHMMSEDNWRRFRSPEDNGREMLEIYLQDGKDSDVPLAGKALQNWHLNSDSDTLEVGLNYNTKPIHLFGTTVYTGEDFYRELVKSDAFTKGVTNRVIDFFFPQKSSTEKLAIADKIVASKPETWQDILLQIIFSKEYLLHNSRALSAEESFFSLAKKTDYRNRRDTFAFIRYYLDYMHQLIYMGAKYSYFLLFILSIPILFETEIILKLWLKIVPKYTIVFTQLVIINILIDSISGPLMTAAQASGKIKKYQSVVGGLLLLILPISYLFLKLGFPPQVTMIINIFISLLALYARLKIISPLVNLSIKKFINDVIIRIVSVTIFAMVITLIIKQFFVSGFLQFFIVSIVSVITTLIITYYIGLNKKERVFLQLSINKLITKMKNA